MISWPYNLFAQSSDEVADLCGKSLGTQETLDLLCMEGTKMQNSGLLNPSISTIDKKCIFIKAACCILFKKRILSLWYGS